MIIIVDYKVGNLGSVMNMFKKTNVPAEVSSDPQIITKADGILLPGIGRFDFAMKALIASKLIPVLNEFAFDQKKPILGICVGYQLMAKHSEEGDCAGLGWFDAHVKKMRFPEESDLRVPHMGWNSISVSSNQVHGKELLKFEDPETRFYFAHSYYVDVHNSDQALAKTKYGFEFDAALAQDQIFGVQFHPEKSHRFGMQLFRNFGDLVDLEKSKRIGA
ncbi:MAG: imidazole glycerol phosphate synthase subunit HisH [Pseudobdellovibrionaceae bacterium]